ncbi:Bug family tripartite tricarboxylate transporter substrate binding protein [Falsiroseomonas bella]|nr:tripartite tricarboxylate transporter substrate binding protein [Falsiroseomonas bella]
MSALSRRALLASLLLPAVATAQTETWPSRAITLVVPFAPGGPVDNVARPLADGLRRHLGPVVVENRAGAGGVVGTRLVAAARPDGYTLLVGSPGPLVIAPAASADAPDPLQALAPIALIASSPQILAVNAELPATTLAEFVALARTRPGGLNMGSAGIGTTPHLAMELLGQIASVRFEHIPYRGTGAALPDLVGGKIDGLFGDISAVLPLLPGGRVRALAITGDRRSPLAPDIPAAAELGLPALRVRNFQALLAPAGTPAPILDRVAAAVTAAQQDEAVRAALTRQGAEAVPSSPAQLTTFLQEERATWDPIVKAIGLTLR